MSAGLGFGLISAQRSPGDPRTWTDLYREALDLTALAEQLGYRSVWTTEHHFIDDGYMASLLPMSAAMAARTSTIEIGTGVVLAPLHHPLRLAEDAAAVQLISDGRFTLGLGLGWMPVEFEALGADLKRRGRAMDEILTILPRAWSGRPFTHHGDVFSFPEIGVRPTPETPIPIVIGGGAEPAVRRAARMAQGFFSNASPAKLAEQVAWATDELEKADRDPAGFRWIYYTVMCPGANRESAWERARTHVHAMRWKYGDMEPSANRSGELPHPPPLSDKDEDQLRKATLLGTGADIAEQVAGIQDAVDVDLDIVARSYFPTMTFDEQAEVMQQLAEEVAPLL
ncbi:MAG: LLM class flavin-dependent oxidoreductase [Acidimicrobiia bacterium]|nr:LLM class flavin-dependent oxidoreductase [Acidimicrobiia bacterium]MBT8192261.1 LLM class flavin-dependent oxidoreductase [Acidimicrobiia bacterium]NNF88828.1 LLM class flavin-dependent oxidoreductase [Acidimicrobiia bacterium]NNL13934.1 LLM class flavin-dependent oxidoreductase [Acidimicrobiia bacterium]